jgi:hypothetical protein
MHGSGAALSSRLRSRQHNLEEVYPTLAHRRQGRQLSTLHVSRTPSSATSMETHEERQSISATALVWPRCGVRWPRRATTHRAGLPAWGPRPPGRDQKVINGSQLEAWRRRWLRQTASAGMSVTTGDHPRSRAPVAVWLLLCELAGTGGPAVIACLSYKAASISRFCPAPSCSITPSSPISLLPSVPSGTHAKRSHRS